MLFDVAREASTREEFGCKRVDRKELPDDRYYVLFAAKIVTKTFSDVAPGNFRDRAGAALQNSKALFLQGIVAELNAQKACDFTELPCRLARQRLAGAIALADAFLIGRYHQAGAQADRRHPVVGGALLQRCRQQLREFGGGAHTAISGTPASVRSWNSSATRCLCPRSRQKAKIARCFARERATKKVARPSGLPGVCAHHA